MVALVMISFRSGRLGSKQLQMAEKKIDVQAALVRFVDDNGVVLVQTRDRLASRPAECRRS